MSRRVCETCAWWAAGEYGHGICAYDFYVLVNNTADVAHEAAERIRMSDDTCEHWERDGGGRDMSDESIWRMRVLSTTMPEYVGELVRCKDCAYHDEHGYMPGRVTCRIHSGIWGGDDFCSKAEKMEDGGSDDTD